MTRTLPIESSPYRRIRGPDASGSRDTGTTRAAAAPTWQRARPPDKPEDTETARLVARGRRMPRFVRRGHSTVAAKRRHAIQVRAGRDHAGTRGQTATIVPSYGPRIGSPIAATSQAPLG